jgi:hypothetical protein
MSLQECHLLCSVLLLLVTVNVPSSLILVTLMIEAICSSETSAWQQIGSAETKQNTATWQLKGGMEEQTEADSASSGRVNTRLSCNTGYSVSCMSFVKDIEYGPIAAVGLVHKLLAQPGTCRILSSEGISKHQQLKKKSITTALSTVRASVYTQRT